MDLTTGTSGPPAPLAAKRRVRNLLIDGALQLRLAAYLVAVAGALCAALAWMLWDAYQETSRVVALSSPDAGDALATLFADGDRGKLLVLTGALAVVLVLLLVSSLVVTHRIAGPAFALRRACQEIARGDLAPPRPLRSGDLLQELGEDFATMVASLRARDAQERAAVSGAAAVLRAPGSSAAAHAEVAAMLERLAAEKAKRLSP